jgi:general transcription factor 3C polypeptide 3 (transcription factor C subunit 4)
MQEVIRIEPRAVSAWSVLAQCQADSNEQVKALQLRIMAAHLMHDPDEWYNLATQSRSVVRTNLTGNGLFMIRRALGYSHQALYCYSKVHSLDPTNVDALWDRAILAKEIGQLKTVTRLTRLSIWRTYRPYFLLFIYFSG